METVDQDIQCLLCDRVIAEWRGGRLRLNAQYGADARAALVARRCSYCGGGLVAFQVVANLMDGDPFRKPRQRPRAG